MCGVPQGLIPEVNTVQHSNFIGELGREIECTLSKFVNDTKPCAAIDMMEGKFPC